jgi:bla regulator protein blaR1
MEILNQTMINLLGWTIVHATWQALIFLGVYLLIYLLTPKATFRYWTGIFLEFAQFLTSIFTFIYLYSQPNSFEHQKIYMAKNFPLTVFQSVTSIINNNLGLFVEIWVLGFGLLMIRLIISYAAVYKLKTHPTNQNHSDLQLLTDTLKTKLNISQNVVLKISTQVSIPMIMGVLKPTILIPASLLTGFSMAQLEVILAHEMAHLKRQDFLINGFQSIIESFYFFHPAMWVLGAQIRHERENCCDDIAVECTQNKILLAKSLIQLQETHRTPSLALAFGKKRMSFVERIQRIVGIHKTKNLSRETFILVLSIFITVMGLAQTKTKRSLSKPKKESFVNILSGDSLDETSFRIQIKDKTSDFEIINDKVYFNGKIVESTNPVQFQALMQELKAKHKELDIANEKLNTKTNKLYQEQSQKFEPISNSLAGLSEKMSVISDKISKLSETYAKAVSKKNLSDKQYDEITKKYEEEIAIQEKAMEVYENQIDKYTLEMDKQNELYEQIFKDMELLEKPVESISKEIDAKINDIVDLLPEHIKTKVSKSLNEIPTPPRPPAPLSPAYSAPKPPKPPVPASPTISLPKAQSSIPPPPPVLPVRAPKPPKAKESIPPLPPEPKKN